MNFDFIDKCYEVEEQIYDPEILRDELTEEDQSLGIRIARSRHSARHMRR